MILFSRKYETDSLVFSIAKWSVFTFLLLILAVVVLFLMLFPNIFTIFHFAFCPEGFLQYLHIPEVFHQTYLFVHQGCFFSSQHFWSLHFCGNCSVLLYFFISSLAQCWYIKSQKNNNKNNNKSVNNNLSRTSGNACVSQKLSEELFWWFNWLSNSTLFKYYHHFIPVLQAIWLWIINKDFIIII